MATRAACAGHCYSTAPHSLCLAANDQVMAALGCPCGPVQGYLLPLPHHFGCTLARHRSDPASPKTGYCVDCQQSSAHGLVHCGVPLAPCCTKVCIGISGKTRHPWRKGVEGGESQRRGNEGRAYAHGIVPASPSRGTWCHWHPERAPGVGPSARNRKPQVQLAAVTAGPGHHWGHQW